MATKQGIRQEKTCRAKTKKATHKMHGFFLNHMSLVGCHKQGYPKLSKRIIDYLIISVNISVNISKKEC